MIKIEKNKCVACKKCISHCPTGIISIEDNKAHVAHAQHCLACGHCQGVCDFSAISLFDKTYEDKNAIQNVSFSDLKELIKSNRSIRRFKEKLIDDSVIKEILQTLEYTASAKNEQAVKWVVISGTDKVKEVLDLSVEYLKENNLLPELLEFMSKVRNPITVDAPYLLIAYAEENSIKPYDDCMIKMSMASLLLHSMQIGSCYLGYLADFINNSKKLKSYLNLTETQKVYSAIGFGYSDETYKKLPTRKEPCIRTIQ